MKKSGKFFKGNAKKDDEKIKRIAVELVSKIDLLIFAPALKKCGVLIERCELDVRQM